MNHVWGLFSHPDREMQVINRENETISHHYTHHVLLMAAIPVICAFIGTTQIGWNFGDGTILKLSWSAFRTGVLLSAMISLSTSVVASPQDLTLRQAIDQVNQYIAFLKSRRKD